MDMDWKRRNACLRGMRAARWRVGLTGLLGLLLWGCGSPAPPLPAVDGSRFAPAVREAIAKAVKAAEAAPGDARRAADYGMVLHAHENMRAAIGAYRRALALDGGIAGVSYYLGVALASEGEYGAAVVELRKALGAEPDSLAVRLKLADALFAAGDAAGAQAEYRELIRRDDGLAQGHFGLARTLQGPEAVAELRRALALFPRYGVAQFALAGHYRRAGNVAEAEKALATYERDKTTVPPLADAAMEKIYDLSVSSTGLIRRAQFLDNAGRTGEALALHEQVVAADPKFEQAWVNLISLYGRTEQPEKAKQAYEKAIALAPNRAEAYYNYGVLSYGLGRTAEAGEAFRKALDLDAGHARAAHNLGLMLAGAGKLDAAEALYRKSIGLEPEHRMARFHLAQVLVARRQYGAAIEELERIVEPADEQTPTYLYALGATQFRAGQAGKAREVLERARGEAMRRGQQGLVASIERDLGAMR